MNLSVSSSLVNGANNDGEKSPNLPTCLVALSLRIVVVLVLFSLTLYFIAAAVAKGILI